MPRPSGCRDFFPIPAGERSVKGKETEVRKKNTAISVLWYPPAILR